MNHFCSMIYTITRYMYANATSTISWREKKMRWRLAYSIHSLILSWSIPISHVVRHKTCMFANKLANLPNALISININTFRLFFGSNNHWLGIHHLSLYSYSSIQIFIYPYHQNHNKQMTRYFDSKFATIYFVRVFNKLQFVLLKCKCCSHFKV